MPKTVLFSLNSKPTTSSQLSSATAPGSSKDYASAFASLQSSLGFNGAAPCLPSITSKNYSSTRQPSLPSSSSPSPSSPPPSSTPSKNYAAAFGALQSSYGFGGLSPHSRSSSSNKR
ncbi:hypothetical protein BU17DRAFT_79561 [Hysterangium stoloniferum]|nr:hypothetical protein BU17DRAFT_79561 [Hysterangium stoloniferum]